MVADGEQVRLGDVAALRDERHAPGWVTRKSRCHTSVTFYSTLNLAGQSHCPRFRLISNHTDVGISINRAEEHTYDIT